MKIYKTIMTKAINKITPPTARMGFQMLKVLLNTITIFESGVLITLKALNKYIFYI